MWVFGYGSLMWDQWETKRGCTRRAIADLDGYRRIFNKCSVKNWGTKKSPCPTLNLQKLHSATCRGCAFEFSDNREKEILAYLKEREGEYFVFPSLPVRLGDGATVRAFVPVYQGKNIIGEKSIKETASMAAKTQGSEGSCMDYVERISAKLRELGIDDPAVMALGNALEKLK